jgi:hypothetical protein
VRYSSINCGLVNQTLQGFSYLLNLVYETKEEQKTGGKQADSETKNTRRVPTTRFILSVFQSLANTGPVIVIVLFITYLRATGFVLRGVVRENADIMHL